MVILVHNCEVPCWNYSAATLEFAHGMDTGHALGHRRYRTTSESAHGMVTGHAQRSLIYLTYPNPCCLDAATSMCKAPAANAEQYKCHAMECTQ